MLKLQLTAKAEADIDDIWEYIANDNKEAAANHIWNIYEKFRLLKNQPNAGVARFELATQLRMLPYERYLIFYRVEADLLLVVRILHASRYITPDFFE